MNDIQKARDVLKRWRDGWPFMSSDEVVDTLRTAEVEKGYRSGWYSEDRLIVGTAGNPDLLDAIDGMLAAEKEAQKPHRAPNRYAERIAAAIIAADERMQQ